MDVAQPIVGRHLSESDAFRFWSKVKMTGLDECWLWKPPSRDRHGYGRFKWNGRTLIAPRVAFALTEGEARVGLFVLHRCDNPPCCNPRHLFVGTARDNTQDMMKKGRGKFTPCDSSRFNIGQWRAKNLSSRGASHPGAKLTDETVRRIKLALANGVKGIDCAASFGCSTYTVSNIKLGKQWSHI